MKRIFTILLVCFSCTLIAQPCLPEGITFTTQTQIDSFNINYPGCHEIEGSVYIIGNDINNLEALGYIELIGGDIIIGSNNSTGTSLTNLWGLGNLTYINGGLFIENNLSMTSLIGLQSLESLDSLSINNNPLLSLCDVYRICNYLTSPDVKVFIDNNGTGCNSVDEVFQDCKNNCLPEGIYFGTQFGIDSFQELYPECEEIMGFVTIEGDNISTLQGLNHIKSVHGRFLIGRLYPAYTNPLLNNLNGLENLTFIGGWLGINWNSNLISCNGLNNLSHIGSFLKFWGNEDLINLNGFEGLVTIGEYLKIYINDELIDLSGLNSLTSIGTYLWIYHNNELIDLTGLESIVSIGTDVRIDNNYELLSISGFNTNNSIIIEGSLSILENSSLTDLYGLENLELDSIDALNIYENPSLSTCALQNICEYLEDSTHIVDIYNNAPGCNSPEEVSDICHYCLPEGVIFSTQTQIDSFQINYPECEHIDGDVHIISGSGITNLNGLMALSSISGTLQIKDNNNLMNLTGLDNLSSIDGNLFIEGNEILKSLTGLSNLNAIDELLWIENNESLKSLYGLENINPSSIYDLMIYNNPALSNCEVQSICEYLLNGYGYVDIGNNAIGCNSPEEVYNACWNNINDLENNSITFKVYPTPTEKWLNIEAQQYESPYNIEIRNPYGQIILEEKDIQSSNYSMNVADLKAGVYFYAIKEKGLGVQQGKLIKK